jgi:hypothetical protein
MSKILGFNLEDRKRLYQWIIFLEWGMVDYRSRNVQVDINNKIGGS